jgi:hypothetical protein
VPKRIAIVIFWLALLSAASSHELLLGLLLYPLGVGILLLGVLSPLLVGFAAWLCCYYLRRHRLPTPVLSMIPRRLRRTRRRWPRPPATHESPTAEMPAVVVDAASAAERAGRAAGSHRG